MTPQPGVYMPLRALFLVAYAAVSAQLISTFVFTTQKVQFLYFLNSKFQASSHLWLTWSETPKTDQDRLSHDGVNPDFRVWISRHCVSTILFKSF